MRDRTRAIQTKKKGRFEEKRPFSGKTRSALHLHVVLVQY